MHSVLLLFAVMLPDHLIVHGALSTDDQLRQWNEYGANAAKDLIAIVHSKEDANANALRAVETILSKRFWEMDLHDIEMEDQSLYSCGYKGYVDLEHFSNVRESKTSLESNSDERNLRAKYHFVKPMIRYAFSVHYKRALLSDFKDDLTIKFDTIDAELRGKLDLSTELIDRINKRECIFHIKEMKVTSMPTPEFTFNTRSVRRRHATKSLNELIAIKLNRFKEELEILFKTHYYEALATTGKWLCIEQGADALKMNNDKQTVSTENFKKYCGN